MTGRDRESPRIPQWTLPLGYTLVAIVLANVLPRLENVVAKDIDLGVSASAGLTVLSAIASGTMALTAIVFAIAFVMVQFSAVTYSPRVALRFAHDPALFHALGIFFATFTYALAAAAWVDREASGRVPALSWLFAIILLFASLIIFAALVQRLQGMQITNTLRELGDSGRQVIAHLAQPRPRPARTSAALLAADAPVIQELRHQGPPRYVQGLDLDRLVALASRADAVIVMACAVGDTLADDAVMLRLHGAASPIPEKALRGAVRLGLERTVEQDPKYPIRLLVDIAIKALSPAINDPTTAVQAIDQIEDLLRRLARIPLDDGAEADAQGSLRLVVPMPSWDDYLSLAFDEIRMFGVTSLQVLRRLRSALIGLLELLGEDLRAGSVRAYLEHMDAVIAASALDTLDRGVAVQQDPQGLGLTRRP